MSSIDLMQMVKKLRTAEEEQTFTPPPISPYVRQHIYEPLLRGEQVLFADLDFTAFTDDNLDELEQHISLLIQNTSRLETLNEVFCRRDPASVARRAFC